MQSRRTNGLTPARREEIIQAITMRADALNLRAPLILFLEMHAPVAFLGSQLLLAAQPFVGLLVGDQVARDLAEFSEDPVNLELLIARLEQEPLNPGHHAGAL